MTQPVSIVEAQTTNSAAPVVEDSGNIEAAVKALREVKAADAKADASDALEVVTDGTEFEAVETPAVVEPGKHTVELEEKDALKIRLRSERAEKARAVESDRLRLAQEREAFKQDQERLASERAEVAKAREREAHLASLKKSDRKAWMREMGFDLNELVSEELATLTPEAKAARALKMAEDIPALVEKRAAELIEAKLAEREAKQTEQRQQQQQQEAVYESQRQFVGIAKTMAEDKAFPTPMVAKLADSNPRQLVHMAFYAQQVFKEERGRMPSHRELAANVEHLFFKTGSEAAPTTGSGGAKRITPRAAAKERSAKPIEDMSEQERMSAAVAELRRTKQADE